MLTKRAYDRRVLHVDMTPVLREGDVIEQVESVAASPPQEGGVPVVISSISRHDRAVSFVAAGGAAGQAHQVAIRVSTRTTPVQLIEGVVRLEVE